MLVAYYKAKSVLDYCKVPGAMAAVIGISLPELEELVPEGEEVTVACHNSDVVHTISGEEKAIGEFLKVLEEKNIKCKPVKSCGFAFHSPQLKDSYPYYQENLEKVRRSSKENIFPIFKHVFKTKNVFYRSLKSLKKDRLNGSAHPFQKKIGKRILA